MPSPAPAGPYTGNMDDDLIGTDPNGRWELYVSDDRQGQTGALYGSWKLRFYYP